MADNITFYKLPLDNDHDKDIQEWLDSIARNKKAEVVRYALRYYKSQLKEGETFILPSSTVSSKSTMAAPPQEEPKKTGGKKPKIGLRNIKQVVE
ncbi:hypothetical protein [Peribacillus frigoritolerans]|uniref:Uncharacterized protein n=1 Tax=Peribacillus castrilensis TaxID=2897690 RepID=A0AAW9NR38_9BACI|nr:hypothetical protein [Peribacillus castrilensis]